MSFSDDQPHSLSWRLYLEDCEAHLMRYRDESIDLIVTDPAYAALEKHRVTKSGKARGTTVRLSQSDGSSNKWFPIFPDARYARYFELSYRAQAKNAHHYVMCAADLDQINVIVHAAREAGYFFWKPIVWDKCRAGMGYHWRASHEVILFFEKGKRKLNNLGWPDVIKEPSLRNRGASPAMLEAAVAAYNADARTRPPEFEGEVPAVIGADGNVPPSFVMHGDADPRSMMAALDAVVGEVQKDVPSVIAEPGLRGKGFYPTEKPVGLWTRLISNSSNLNELVVDPFLGGGGSCEAAVRLGRRFAGCDIVQDAIDHTNKRMRDL